MILDGSVLKQEVWTQGPMALLRSQIENCGRISFKYRHTLQSQQLRLCSMQKSIEDNYCKSSPLVDDCAHEMPNFLGPKHVVLGEVSVNQFAALHPPKKKGSCASRYQWI